MKALNQKQQLESKILDLKSQQSNQFNDLRSQYYDTIESIKPLNLLKSATASFMSQPNLKSNLINGVIGFGVNYVSKKFINVNSANPAKRIFGKVLKFAINNFIGKKSRISSDIV